jgi:hypothetical protein
MVCIFLLRNHSIAFAYAKLNLPYRLAVVAGIRTPEPIERLKLTLPQAYDELLRNVEILESRYHDMQDIEFTVQEGKLYMLQTRNGKRSGPAAINIALDMIDEGLNDADQAIMMVKPEHLKQLLHPQFTDTSDVSYVHAVVAKGLAASPGAAVGELTIRYFTNYSVFLNHPFLYHIIKAKSCFLLQRPKLRLFEARNAFLFDRIHHQRTLEECGQRREF